MNAASWVNSIAATSSTFEHVSGIVKKGGWRRQRGCSFAMGFVTHSRGSASQKNTPMRGDHGKKNRKVGGGDWGVIQFSNYTPYSAHRFVIKPSPNSFSVKKLKQFLNFRLFATFFRRKYQPTKNRFVTTAASVEPWMWKIGRISS